MVGAKLAPIFERAEPRRRLLACVTGLLSTAERKNSWQLAELAGETTPDGMQRLLSTAHWYADAVRDDLVAYILEQLADLHAVLALDETAFVKKSAKPMGVARKAVVRDGDGGATQWPAPHDHSVPRTCSPLRCAGGVC